ncbi:Hsp20/alpha crystallin family protein [Rivibacter subsaxonicus]|uniref:HSP20 family molecular chaperone IbpA n=1 Tax=Rivibacter subsaxonicus TaxID=457575 RepID=A0A4Q7W0Q5_9BURK|nr:Hsp20/alpha crystallin family protein [Rivibacter subsaxonicus]RZU02690.1 HSP20 family molecular chaperone IbpA [Rivibacter subsaxonicus]
MNTLPTPGVESRRANLPATEPALVPPVDVVEDGTGITLRADLPGVPRDKLQLQVENGTLTLEGQVDLPLPDGMAPHHAEVELGRWRRVFSLSKELDSAAISAELEQGVLTLRIPKAQHAQPRRIEVKVS